jgi:hypothetical protein
MKMSKTKKLLLQDLAIIVLSVIIAVILAKTDIIISILTSSAEWEALGSFFGGLLFTSVFTTAPAIVTLGEIGQVHSVWKVALVGAMGAVTGDLIIFKFIKDRFSVHLADLLRHESGGKRFQSLIKNRVFIWLTFMLGGLIIASPLPDELGISLLGFSKMRRSWFILLSFVFNFLGILLIGYAARSLAQ